MSVLSVPRRGPCWGAAACLALLLASCGRTAPAPVESVGLDREYVSVDAGDTCSVLVLEDDGRFLVVERLRDAWEERRMRPAPEPIAEGTWAFSAGRLALEGEGWRTLFEADSTRVELLARTDVLRSLRWVTSTEGSPFTACELVSMADFDEFVHPTEGSGSSGM